MTGVVGEMVSTGNGRGFAQQDADECWEMMFQASGAGLAGCCCCAREPSFIIVFFPVGFLRRLFAALVVAARLRLVCGLSSWAGVAAAAAPGPLRFHQAREGSEGGRADGDEGRRITALSSLFGLLSC